MLICIIIYIFLKIGLVFFNLKASPFKKHMTSFLMLLPRAHHLIIWLHTESPTKYPLALQSFSSLGRYTWIPVAPYSFWISTWNDMHIYYYHYMLNDFVTFLLSLYLLYVHAWSYCLSTSINLLLITYYLWIIPICIRFELVHKLIASISIVLLYLVWTVILWSHRERIT